MAKPYCKGLDLITCQSPCISMVDKVSMEHVCLPVLWFSPVCIVSPILRPHHRNAILITPCKRSLGNLTAMDFWMMASARQSTVALHLSARPVHKTSVVNKQATQQVFLKVWFSVSITSPMLHSLIEYTHQLPQQQHTKYQSSSTSQSFIYPQDRYHHLQYKGHSHPTPIRIKIPHNFSSDSTSMTKREYKNHKHWNPFQCASPVWFQELTKYQ